MPSRRGREEASLEDFLLFGEDGRSQQEACRLSQQLLGLRLCFQKVLERLENLDQFSFKVLFFIIIFILYDGEGSPAWGYCLFL